MRVLNRSFGWRHPRAQFWKKKEKKEKKEKEEGFHSNTLNFFLSLYFLSFDSCISSKNVLVNFSRVTM